MSELHDHSHCRSMLGNLSEFIDGELQQELCSQIEEHMKTCENCRVVVDTLRKTVELYERNEGEEELPHEIKERLYIRLNLEDLID